jgi:hypothetical protein
MRLPASPFRRRRRNRVARAIEDAALRVLAALWLARLFVRHGLRYVR